MSRDANSPPRRLLRDDRGAVAIIVAIAFPVLIGLAALGVDAGYLFYAKQVLQASTDAAALAGAQGIGNGGTPLTTATSYSAVATNKNAVTNLSIAMAAGYPQLKCLANWATSSGVACSTNQTPSCATASSGCAGANGANVIEVRQTANVPTFFATIFGISSVS
ncbi:MAG TPA: TadE/TadG family type IV pilus assembly protein, partial [Tepidisphaeraceae bacterium]|nr:TadE/TadG family type IV pilus assembly protein [Tepidisphaeraceae bacterium]